jgi:DNA (cytosine-5)-methyltransferase 1
MKVISHNRRNMETLQQNNQSAFKDLFYEGIENLKLWRPITTKTSNAVDVLDFFSGCGGMSLGFASLSVFNIIGGVDINEIALKTFERNFNTKTLQKDIRELYLAKDYKLIQKYFGIEEKSKRKKPLVIIGCAPCQGFSAHTKKNKGKSDERNTLIGAFAEIIVKLEPDFIVMENVPEILGDKYLHHYREAKEIFTTNGYFINQQIYNSATFEVPQARNRAIIIASKSEFSLPKGLLNPEEFKTVKDAIGDLPKINPGEISKKDYYHRCASHKKSTIETISKVPKNGGSRPKGIGPKCLDKVNGFYDVYGRLSWDKPAITITQYSRNPASGRFSHPVQNRGLTIREAARIQSFPDGFVFEGNLDECFKQIGEAVPPLLSLAIASQIANSLSSQKVLSKEKTSKISKSLYNGAFINEGSKIKSKKVSIA